MFPTLSRRIPPHPAAGTLASVEILPAECDRRTESSRESDMADARSMWALFEPVHAVTYFAPQAREHFTAAGLRGFWRGYFAGRAAPLGEVQAAPVVAAFFNFAPGMVRRAIPEVWTMVSARAALDARVEGAVASLAPLVTDVPDARLELAADVLTRAAAAIEPAGRVVGAANAALAPYEGTLARLWQAATTLREHRGDGHVAALVTAGIGPCEVLALRCGMDLSREVMQTVRGWTDDEWREAQAGLVSRGWLDSDGVATSAGEAAYRRVEDATDLAAGGPWRALGVETVRRAVETLRPIAAACHGVLPVGNPIGIPPLPPIPAPRD